MPDPIVSHREIRAGRIAFWIHLVLIVAAIAGCVGAYVWW